MSNASSDHMSISRKFKLVELVGGVTLPGLVVFLICQVVLLLELAHDQRPLMKWVESECMSLWPIV